MISTKRLSPLTPSEIQWNSKCYEQYQSDTIESYCVKEDSVFATPLAPERRNSNTSSVCKQSTVTIVSTLKSDVRKQQTPTRLATTLVDPRNETYTNVYCNAYQRLHHYRLLHHMVFIIHSENLYTASTRHLLGGASTSIMAT